MKFIITTVFVFILWVSPLSDLLGQNTDFSQIANLRKQSIESKQDLEKHNFNDSLVVLIHGFLNDDNSYNVTLSDRVQYLGDIYSPDGELRIITWNVGLTDGTHDYYCYIQLKPDENGESKWFELNDHHKQIDRPKNKTLKKDNWFGCLYYSIIPIKHDKQIIYTLLGWEGNNNYSTKKIIDVISFSSRNEPVFGKSIFVGEKYTQKRVVFEYSKEAYLLLRYNEDSKQIVFNRLEPEKPELKGLFSFYTPTLFYDAYELKKGKWNLNLDINPKNGKSNTIYHDPTKTPKLPHK